MSAISPNEFRDLEDLPLLDDPEADKTYMQLGFGTLENVAKGVANGGAVGTLMDVLASVSAGTLDKQAAVELIVTAFPDIGTEGAGKIVDGVKPSKNSQGA